MDESRADEIGGSSEECTTSRAASSTRRLRSVEKLCRANVRRIRTIARIKMWPRLMFGGGDRERNGSSQQAHHIVPRSF